MTSKPSALGEARSAQSPDTETLLNGLIAECTALLRDVAFRSACQTENSDDRLRFLTAAESLALTGAKVAESVARLRSGPPQSEHRQRITVEHLDARPQEGGGGYA